MELESAADHWIYFRKCWNIWKTLKTDWCQNACKCFSQNWYKSTGDEFLWVLSSSLSALNTHIITSICTECKWNRGDSETETDRGRRRGRGRDLRGKNYSPAEEKVGGWFEIRLCMRINAFCVAAVIVCRLIVRVVFYSMLGVTECWLMESDFIYVTYSTECIIYSCLNRKLSTIFILAYSHLWPLC